MLYQAIQYSKPPHLLLPVEEGLPRERGKGVGASLVLRRGRVGSGRPELPAAARGPAFPGLPTSPLPILLFFISKASSFLNLHVAPMCQCVQMTPLPQRQVEAKSMLSLVVGKWEAEERHLDIVAKAGEGRVCRTKQSQLLMMKIRWYKALLSLQRHSFRPEDGKENQRRAYTGCYTPNHAKHGRW